MSGCVCKGNLRLLVSETVGLFDRTFVSDYHPGEFTFYGLVLGSDDYYYGMVSKETGKQVLSSCVGSLETNGWKIKEIA